LLSERGQHLWYEKKKKGDVIVFFFSSSFSFLFLFLSPVNGELCKEWKEEKWREKDNNNTVKHFLPVLKQMSVDVRGTNSERIYVTLT
jgi:hypothetical protein